MRYNLFLSADAILDKLKLKKLSKSFSEVKYNPEFIREMDEIRKEKSISLSSYEELFDDE